MDDFKSENFETETHSSEIDYIFDKEHENIDEIVWENKDLVQDLKTYFRFFRKKFFSKNRKKTSKNFTNIIYLTLDCPMYTPNSMRDDNPMEYISEMRKQYPDNYIRLLIPIINIEEKFRLNKKNFIVNGC